MVALAEIMDNPKVEVQVAKEKLEDVLETENEIKRQRLETMLLIKNILTPQQQQFLDTHKDESTNGYEIISSVNEDPRVVVKVSGKTDAATPLYILRDGSKEKIVTDMNQVDPDEIQSIQVLKGPFNMYGEKGKNGVVYEQRHGLCFEPEHYPDSPNQENFPSVVLNPGEEYMTSTIWKFGVVE